MSRELDSETKARIKDASRESRLSFRNFAEHQMRQEFKDKAKDACKAEIADFAKCAEEQGLWVVWNCRQVHKKFNDCMAIHNSNEAWEEYKKEHAEELDKRTLRT